LCYKNFDDPFDNFYKVHVYRKFDTGDPRDIPLSVDQPNKLFIRAFHEYDPWEAEIFYAETVVSKPREITIEYTKPPPPPQPETDMIVNDSAFNSVVFSSVFAGLTLAYLN